MKKQNGIAKRLIICFIVAILIELAIVSSQPNQYKYSFKDGTSALSGDYKIEVSGYEYKDGYFIPLNNDPQIYIGGLSIPIQSVEIQLDDAENINARIYYPDKNGELNEQNATNFHVDENILVGIIPYAEYPFIRIDINSDFQLKDIRFSAQPLERSTLNKTFSSIRVSVIFLIIFVGWILYDRFLKKRKMTNMQRPIARFKKFFFEKKVYKFLLVWALAFTIAAMTEPFMRQSGTYGLYRLIFIGAILGLVFLGVFYWKEIYSRPETIFAIVSLAAGLVLCITLPRTTGVSWDDEAHFVRSMHMSYFGTPKITRAELSLGNISLPPVYDEESIQVQAQKLEQMFSEGAVAETIPRPYRINTGITYLPAAIGLFIGRLLHLRYTLILVMGRISSLLFYTIIVYFSIKKTPVGKMIMTVYALLPTNIFLACNYSYDTWITALTMLWLAIFFKEWKCKERSMTTGKTIVMLSIFVLAYIHKVIYGVLGIIFLLMPKEKFVSPNKRNRFYGMIFLAIFVLALIGLLGFVASPASFSDVRGGTDVNAIEQIKFIIGHPISYAFILIKHLFSYFSLGFSQNYMMSMAYMGYVKCHLETIALLTAVIFTDRNETDIIIVDGKWKRIFVYLAVLAAVSLASTSVYISFTPVRSEVINGAQGRYLLPAILPAFIFLGTGKIKNVIERYKYNFIVTLGSAGILFSGIWECCISKYMVA